MTRRGVPLPSGATATVTQQRAVTVCGAEGLEVHIVKMSDSKVVPARPGISHDPFWRLAFDSPARSGLISLL